MKEQREREVLEATVASALAACPSIQTLWSSYGEIVRCTVPHADNRHQSVVVKYVHRPRSENHPRGWNTDQSHARKDRSCTAETAWCANRATRCPDAGRVPAGLGQDAEGADWRRLYPHAWTDFFRFLPGWTPGHWKIHNCSRRLAREVLTQL